MRRTARKHIVAVIALLSAVTLGILGSSGIAGAAQSVTSAGSTSPLGRSAVPSSGIGMPEGLNNRGDGVLRSAMYYARALKSKLWLPGPNGLVYQSCVYTVPNGSTVDTIHGRITSPTGAVRPLQRCAYPMLANPAAVARAIERASRSAP